jgi:hypothetical protein
MKPTSDSAIPMITPFSEGYRPKPPMLDLDRGKTVKVFCIYCVQYGKIAIFRSSHNVTFKLFDLPVICDHHIYIVAFPSAVLSQDRKKVFSNFTSCSTVQLKNIFSDM